MAYRSNDRHGTLSPEAAEEVGYGLGWFSIGLGLAELFGARPLARALGMEGRETVLEAYGLREIVTGIGILSSENPGPWLWGRVAGDGLDIATLMAGLHEDNPRRENVAIALAAVAGVTVLDVLAAQALTGKEARREREHRRRQWQERLQRYRQRSGFRRGVNAMRGAARDFEVPRDFRVPEALRPWTDGAPPASRLSASAAGH